MHRVLLALLPVLVRSDKIYYVVNTLADDAPAPYCAPENEPVPGTRDCTYREALKNAGAAKASTPIEIVLPERRKLDILEDALPSAVEFV